MRRPSFQFYPADWRNNANLRRCSWAARGVWIEVMGLLHDSDRYGALHWTLKEIAQAIGCPVALVKELASKDVLKGCDSGSCDSLIYVPRSGRKDGKPVTLIEAQDGPIWFSSRMVKDEYIREVRGESTRFDGDKKDTPKPAPKPPIGESPKPAPKPIESDGSTSSSSSTGKPSETIVSGGKPPAMKPEEIIFSYGVPLLTNAGTAEKQARSFLGGLRKAHGDGAVVNALRECLRVKPLQPLEWLAKALPPAGAQGHSKQTQLESRNAAVVAGWVPPELREKEAAA